MSNYAKAIILGRVGSIDLIHTPSGMAIVNMSVATNVKKKESEKTLWHSVKVFGKAAETCNQYLETGSQVMVDANIDMDEWDDKDGKKRSKVVYLANNVQFLGDKKADTSDGVGF